MCDIKQKYLQLSEQIVKLIPAYRNQRPSQRAKAPWTELINAGLSHITDIPVADFSSRMNSLIAFKPSVEDDLVAATSFLPDDAQLVERYYLFYNDLSAIPNCKTCGKQLKPKKRFRMTDSKATKAGYGTYCDIKCGSSDPEVIQQRRDTNIERRGVDVPAKSKEVRDKMQATLQKNHGVTSPIHSEAIRTKHRATNKAKYGTASTSAFASKQTLEKVKVTNLRKYGCENPMGVQEFAHKAGNGKRKHAYAQLHKTDRVGDIKPLFAEDEYFGVMADRESGMPHRYPWECLACGTEFMGGLENDGSISGSKPRCPSCFPKEVSQGEREILDVVKMACPDGTHIEHGDRELLSGRELDIVIPSLKLAIEYNGIYWHSAYAGGKDKDYHQSKLEATNQQGYRLIYVWEDELYNRPTAIKQAIMEACGHGTVIDADECEIVTGAEFGDDLELYHRDGTLTGVVTSYVLKYQGQAAAVLQVAQRPRRRGDAVGKAALRYSVINGYQVPKGFKRLLSEAAARVRGTKLFTVEIDPSFDDPTPYGEAGFEYQKEIDCQGWFLMKPCKYGNRLPRKELVARASLIDPAFNANTTLHDSRLKEVGADRVWGVKRQVWQLEVKK